MNKFQNEIVKAIDDIKVKTSANSNFTDDDIEILFLTSLLEEETNEQVRQDAR
jgi:hypothetical protein